MSACSPVWYYTRARFAALVSFSDELAVHSFPILCLQSCVFQAGFRGTSGFREWLPRILPKQTEIAWGEIRNHISMRLQQHWRLDNCMGFHEQRKHLRKVPLQQKGWNAAEAGCETCKQIVLRLGFIASQLHGNKSSKVHVKLWL